MKKVILTLLTLVSSLVGFSQSNYVATIPVKDLTTYNMMLEDSVCSYVLKNQNIQPSIYKIVDLSELVATTTLFNIQRINHEVTHIEVLYKTLKDLKINFSKNHYFYTCDYKPNKIKNKVIHCFKTLEPDGSGEYKLYINIVTSK